MLGRGVYVTNDLLGGRSANTPFVEGEIGRLVGSLCEIARENERRQAYPSLGRIDLLGCIEEVIDFGERAEEAEQEIAASEREGCQ